MSFEWKIKKVDEIKADISNAIAMGPFGSNIKTENFVARGVPVIRGINLSKGKLYEEEYVYITEEKADELKSSNAFPGDLVFTHRGTLGQVGIIPFNSKYRRYVVSQSQMKLTCNTKQVNPLFVYYFFKSNIGQHALLMNTSTTGVPAISRPVTSLKNIEIPLPALDEQQRIVDILNAFDDKIELNNAINKNLEEMAQALFKRWFVDFEFPNENGEPYKSSGGEFEESELGLIPKGWSVDILDDLCEMIFSGGTPSTKNEAYWNGDLFWLSSGETRNRYIITTEKRITHDGVENSSTRLAKKYDVVIASAGQGSTRGQTSICLVDTYINQSIIAVRAKKGITFPSYLFFNLSTRYEELRQISDSNSIRGSLTTNTLKKLKIIIPPIEIQYKICSVLDQVINCAEYYQRQNEYLTQIRDTLLPKLMSGEIRVPVEQDHNDPDLLKVAESSANYQP